MRKNKTVKSRTLICVALTLALGPLMSGSVALAATDTPPASSAPAASAFKPQLSAPTRGVAKMLTSGVSEEVVKAYIQNAPSTFNLNADDIIRLQEMGVSGSLTTEMLKHDKAFRENAGVSALPPAAPLGQPSMTASIAPGPGAAAPVSDYDVYDNLAPYGYWNELPEYGWCWQPYSWIGYNAYPWAWLGFGYWSNFPGRGWCWLPHSHFRGFDRFHGNRGSWGGNRFAGNRGSTFQAHARTATPFTAPRTVTGLNHGTAVVRSSAWAPGFSGGFHGSAGGGVHVGAGSSFRGGTGGSFHGGGGGGFHGGGGHGGGSHGGGGHR